jgi:hypothetical protein
VRAGTVLAQVDVMGRHLRIILNVIPWAGSNSSWLSPPVAVPEMKEMLAASSCAAYLS